MDWDERRNAALVRWNAVRLENAARCAGNKARSHPQDEAGAYNKRHQMLEEGRLSDAVLTPGVIAAIAYAVNHPGVVVERDSAEYSDLMDMFQDWIPFELIDCNQWWFGHYWSSGHSCKKCQEIVHLFRYGVPGQDQRLEAIYQSMTSDHAPDCNARNVSTFDGLRVCLSFHQGTDGHKVNSGVAIRVSEGGFIDGLGTLSAGCVEAPAKRASFHAGEPRESAEQLRPHRLFPRLLKNLFRRAAQSLPGVIAPGRSKMRE